MKRIVILLALAGLFDPVLQPQAKADSDVSIDLFYNNLSGGSWVEVGDYGYCWQPEVAANDPNWRPYADGYWAYTDVGWTWVSYEDFGWATYHYGRWAKLEDLGWVWVPGSDLDWGPAWVSWRTGGDYVGWAPLPPRGPEVVYEGRPIGAAVDVEFDIGPRYYNFCDVRYIGEPVLRERIVDYRRNDTYINQTVNVTNITVQNNTVYNYGPDINVINQRSTRPIQRLRLERQQNVDLATAARSGGATKVQGSALIVAAPMKITRPAKTIAPPTVRTKVAQPKIEKGWAGVDPNTQTQLKQKIKTEDHTKIPPPMTGAGAGAQQAAGGSAPTTATPATTPVIGGQGQHGRRAGEQAQQNPTGTPPMGAAAATSPGAPPQFGKEHKGQHGRRAGEQAQQNAIVTPPATSSPSTSPATAPHFGKEPKGKHGEQLGGANTPMPRPAAAGASQIGGGGPAPEMGNHKGRHGDQLGANAPTPASVLPESSVGRPATEFGKRRGKQGEQALTTPPLNAPAATPQTTLPPGRGGHRQMEHAASGAGAAASTPIAPAGSEQNLNRPRERQNKQFQPGNTPAPQNFGTQNQAVPNAETRGPGAKHRVESLSAAPSGRAAGTAGPGATAAGGTGETRHEKKDKPEKTSPAPTP